MPADTAPPPRRLLTARELGIVALVAEGLSELEIAARLGISRKTVQTHLGNAALATGAKGRKNLVAIARLTGQLPPVPVSEVRCG